VLFGVLGFSYSVGSKMFGGIEGRVHGFWVFGVFIYSFMKFCSLKELWWNTGKASVWVFGVFVVI